VLFKKTLGDVNVFCPKIYFLRGRLFEGYKNYSPDSKAGIILFIFNKRLFLLRYQIMQIQRLIGGLLLIVKSLIIRTIILLLKF